MINKQGEDGMNDKKRTTSVTSISSSNPSGWKRRVKDGVNERVDILQIKPVTISDMSINKKT